jgi:hypothetical protein
MIALDRLPWPVGEDILAHAFALVGLIRSSRRQPILDWAAGRAGVYRWRLLWAMGVFRGRWVARASLIGLRTPADLDRQVVIHGEQHLTPAATGTILLGFHLGPPNADVALRFRGHRLAWLGSPRLPWVWRTAPWLPFADPRDNLTPADPAQVWSGYLYRARRLLLEGGTVFMMADSLRGRQIFSEPAAERSLRIVRGWLALHRHSGARVLPVTTHLEGRTQIITIHPALPAPLAGADPTDAWEPIVTGIVHDYVRRFPEQCATLALRPRL